MVSKSIWVTLSPAEQEAMLAVGEEMIPFNLAGEMLAMAEAVPAVDLSAAGKTSFSRTIACRSARVHRSAAVRSSPVMPRRCRRRA